ncbi:MAG: class I SAM-dependent methyltransferase [Magnetococcales bacterium]|nr:class I SAM-dependent methyltransferase [Magnetococcales bacterium]MBF0154570.1 class I SAM-dependent methyltransferase [Magnetococcales bacterium]MBF0308009.1 class I SAM-dependent methyltransferase [Magnetococcales bacterium]
MKVAFSDHFDPVSAHYARHRPTYPAELFTWLASLCREHRQAWDCGAGSGQASLALTAHFERVLATDASAGQIGKAMRHPGIVYRVAPAEESGLETASCDLVIVAQALHWFDPERFYAEVKRVLKPGGVIAVWCYGILRVAGEEVGREVERFYHRVVGPYWPPERHHVETGYRELPFPFDPIGEVPEFCMAQSWCLAELMGYLRSWSATGACLKATGQDPVVALEQRLATMWGEGERRVSWPLMVKAGLNTRKLPSVQVDGGSEGIIPPDGSRAAPWDSSFCR